MLQVIEDAEEQHVIELTITARIQVADVLRAVIDLRTEQVVDVPERVELDAIDGGDIGPSPLHLKTEPAIPSTDVEQALARQVVRDGKLGDAIAQKLRAQNAIDGGAVRQFETVIPAFAE